MVVRLFPEVGAIIDLRGADEGEKSHILFVELQSAHLLGQVSVARDERAQRKVGSISSGMTFS